MHPTDTGEILTSSVTQVLELMCFSEVQPISEAFVADEVIASSVKFHGSLSGYLWLEMGCSTAHWLTASFLGTSDVAPERSQAEETVCELGNVMCGRFVSRLDPSADLRIDAPVKGKAANTSRELVWQNFRADAGLLRVAFQLNSTNGSRRPIRQF